MRPAHITAAPNRRHLPLAMLRAFEASARHRSMTRAAAELNVTPGAVSRQVAALEAWLGVRLIRRQARGIGLTEDGAHLFHGVFAGFDRVRATVEDLLRPDTEQMVTITTLPTLASHWLLPRLADLRSIHPDITVRLRTSIELDDLSRPDIDFGVRYGAGVWPHVASELLLKVTTYPVCSPQLAERWAAARLKPDTLLSAPLIHDVTRQWWIDWFLQAGVDVADMPGGIVVDEYGLALRFAIEGHGIALARDPLVEAELAHGALVRLSDVEVVPQFAYYVCRDPVRTPSKAARRVMSWLASWHPMQGL